MRTISLMVRLNCRQPRCHAHATTHKQHVRERAPGRRNVAVDSVNLAPKLGYDTTELLQVRGFAALVETKGMTQRGGVPGLGEEWGWGWMMNAGGRGVASVASERANSKHGDAIKVMRCDVKIIGRSHVYMDGRGCQRGFRAIEAHL